MKNLIPRFILEKNKENKFSGNFKASTMFIDISGFTAMTQTLMKNGKEGAEILTEVINKVFTPSIDAIYNNNGFVSIFAGDAFTSIFPIKKVDVQNALSSAIIINNIFEETGLQKTKFGNFQLSVKIGLSFGNVEWKIIRNEKQNSYYFKGEAIDNCSHSEHNCGQGEIVFDGHILDVIEKEIEFKQKGENYYLLKKINKTIPSNSINQANVTNSIAKSFIPKSIIDLKTKGEFRDIISCFISFAETSNIDKNISKVIRLANQFGGYFNKIDFGDKGGVMLILFGAPSGKEKLFTRACDFALSVRDLYLKGFKTRIGLTFGIAFAGFVGSAKRAEYTALGMVVNLSARFMMKADWNEIYVDRYIYPQIKDSFEINHLSDSEFKGFSEKIPVYELLKMKETIRKSFYEGKLVGRKKEQQNLKKFIQPIYDGKFGGVVYIDGIAGIGKSRLVNELREQLQTTDNDLRINWFYLPCDEILKKSFNPLIYFLKRYFNQSDENTKKINRFNFGNKLNNLIEKTNHIEINKELIRTKSFLAGMLNLHGKNSLYEQLGAKAKYENTLYAMKCLLKAESLQKPLIIELEDGHWIDFDTKKFLKLLTGNVKDFPFVIISACRYSDDGSEYKFGLKEVLENRIKLEHLSEEGSNSLVQDKLKTTVPKKTLNLIFEKSDGNPFFIEQIILYLQENQLFDNEFNINTDKFKIPSNINSVIIARIDRLKMELKEVIKTASVLGREFAVKILSKMLLDRPIKRQLLEGKSEVIWDRLTEIKYIFKHALIRESVYEMQLKKELREVHKLAAEVIEEHFKDNLKSHYPDLANHYEKAEITDKTIEYLEKAGNHAATNYLNKLALGFYQKLLALPISKDLRIIITLKKSEVLKIVGEWKEAEEITISALKMSEETGDKSRIAKSLSSLGAFRYLKADYDKAMEYFKRSQTLCEQLGDKAGACLMIGNIGLALRSKGNYEIAMQHYKKQSKISNELGLKSISARAYGNMAIAYAGRGDSEKAISHYEKSLKIKKELKDTFGVALVIGNMGIAYFDHGNYKEAKKCYKKAITICEKIGDKIGIASNMGNLGILLKDTGNYAKAMECYKKQKNTCEDLGDKRGLSNAFGSIGVVYMDQSNNDKALIYYKKQLRLAEEIGYKRGVSIASGNMGIIYKHQGNYAKAMECYNRKLKISEELGYSVGIANVLGNIGGLYYEQGNDLKAADCFEKQMQICKEKGNRNGLSLAYSNIGSIYKDSGNYIKAMECYDKAIAIDYELNLKPNLPGDFFNKANCLYKIQEYDKAGECNNKCIDAAKEIDNKDYFFKSQVLKEKINFKLSDDPRKKLLNIENLKNILKDEKEEENVASLNYELSIMNFELKRNEGAEKYKIDTIKLYKKLYKKTPKIEYKKKIEELEKL